MSGPARPLRRRDVSVEGIARRAACFVAIVATTPFAAPTVPATVEATVEQPRPYGHVVGDILTGWPSWILASANARCTPCSACCSSASVIDRSFVITSR